MPTNSARLMQGFTFKTSHLIWRKSVWGATASRINMEDSQSGELVLKRVAAQQSAGESKHYE